MVYFYTQMDVFINLFPVFSYVFLNIARSCLRDSKRQNAQCKMTNSLFPDNELLYNDTYMRERNISLYE